MMSTATGGSRIMPEALVPVTSTTLPPIANTPQGRGIVEALLETPVDDIEKPAC